MSEEMDMSYARLDYDRQKRCGWPEVIYGEGKTPEQISAIFASLIAATQTKENGRVRRYLCYALHGGTI